MTDFRLTVFCCVARHLSFTKAAKQLGITQPAISNHIQELEQEYATRLFERHSTHIELTTAGETLLTHAQAILQQYKKLNFDMQLHAHALSGNLRLGATPTIARYLLPECLASYATKFKQTKLSLIEGNTYEITQALEQGGIDIGLVEGYERHPHLRYTPIICDELLLIVPANGSWGALDTVSIDGIKKIPLVISTANSDATHLIEKNLSQHSLELTQLNIIMQLADIESIKLFAQHADCAALISSQAIKQEIKTGKFKILNIDTPMRFIREFAFVRNISQTGDITKDFITYLQEMLTLQK